MASPLDLRGRVIMTDGASATLNKIKAGLEAIGVSSRKAATASQQIVNTSRSVGAGARGLHHNALALSGSAAAVGIGLGGIIQSTRQFNESKFGYGFARITDFIKSGKLDIAAWKADMDATANDARAAAKSFGTTADVTMKAREEVEKLGFKGRESEALFSSALGLHLSEPMALASGEAAKYIGAVYRAFEREKEKMAQKLGKDAKDPAFVDAYIKGLAAKAAVAGAESALGPADIVEGMRQFAPQWASMGIPYEFALAALAHGANYGFRAPELGTAYKSMVTKSINPTAAGLGVLNNLGIDRSQFFKSGAVEPGKATNAINSLLSGSVYTGRSGRKNKSHIRGMLDEAYKTGTTTSPEFQERLTNTVMKMLGPAWNGRAEEIQQAVSNATLNPSGDMDLPAYLKALRDAGATIGQISTIFEGRHISRNMPIFQFYEKLIGLYDKLKVVDGTVMDSVVEGRKNTEAGSTDQLFGAWKELMLAMQDTGVIETAKNALIGLAEALRALPPDVVKWGTGLTLLAGGIAALGVAVTAAMPILKALKVLGLLGVAAGAGAAGAVKGSGMAGGWRGPSAVGEPIMGAGAGAAAGGAAGRKFLGRGLLRFIPGLGLVIMGAGAGYGAYQSYARDESGWDILWSALKGSIGMFPAQAEEGQNSGIPPIGDLMRGQGSGPGGQGIISEAQSTMAQLRAALQVDLTAEGRRAMETFAAGIRAGGAEAVAAARDIAAQVRSAASNTVPLNTGPNMQPAR